MDFSAIGYFFIFVIILAMLFGIGGTLGVEWLINHIHFSWCTK